MRSMGKWKQAAWLAVTVLFLLTGIFPYGLGGMVSYGAVLPVSMEITPVYGENAKYGASLPFTVRLYGQTEAPFEGAVCAAVLESGASESEEVYEYAWEVEVKPAETKILKILVPLGQKNSRIDFSLKQADGAQLEQQSVEFWIPRDTGRLFIGTLSDRQEGLSWFDGLSLDYGMVETVQIPLDESVFPETAQGLELLDMVLINDYDGSRLNREQKTALLRWVDGGGVLLFGTGRRGADSFRGLVEETVEVSSAESLMLSVDMGDEFARERPGDANLSLYCTKLSIPEGEVRMEDDGFPLLTMVRDGNGWIGFFPFDLGDVSDFAKENPSYGVRLLTAAMGEDAIYNLYFYGSYGEDTDYWNAQNLVTGGNADRIPNVFAYGAVMLCYIGVVGPGLYLVLRKRRLGKYYGLSVAVVSLIFCGVVYMMGTGTRFTTAFSTYATVLDLSGQKAEETTYLNIRTPDARKFTAKLEPEYEVRALTRSSRYDQVPEAEFAAGRTPSVSFFYGAEETAVQSADNRAFEPRLFRLDREIAVDEDRGIVSSLEIFDGKISGTIENRFPFPLEDAAVFLYGQVLPLGDLEAGEIREIREEELLIWPAGLSYLAAGEMIEQADSQQASEGDVIRAVERTNFYTHFLNQTYSLYRPETRLLAFGPAGGLREEGSELGQSDGMVLYTAVLDAAYERDGLVYACGQRIEPVFTSAGGMTYGSGMMIYGEEPVTAEYSLGVDLEIETVSFLPISECFLEDSRYSYIKQFSGEAEFYNRMTEEWDAVDLWQRDFTKEALSDYLTPEGTLLVKYISGESDTAGISQVLPLVMVTGRER